MATFKFYVSELEQEEAGANVDPAVQDDNSNDLAEVNIAVVGKVGSGRSSFVNVITGLKKNDKNAARSEGQTRGASFRRKEATSYSNLEHPNVKFFIFPISSALKQNLEKCDVFLIFTAGEFSDDHVQFAKEVKRRSKPIFFVRTKIYADIQGLELKEENKLEEIGSNLSKSLKELDYDECKIFLISNNQPDKSEFGELQDAITESLPSPKDNSFKEIPNVPEIIALEKYQEFLKEAKTKQKDVTKFFPSTNEVKELFVKSGITGVQRKMKSDLNAWKKVRINLAILGNSGVGKSSFINAIRGVDDSGKGAAKVGITETTTVPTSFEHPANPKIRFWDLPGIGTPDFPDVETLCEKAGMESYDTFLIIGAVRFTMNDVKLAEKVRNMPRKPSFFFVRTKTDVDFESVKRSATEKVNEENFLEIIRNNCLENFMKFKFDITEKEVFLISSRFPTKWDFDRLGKAILDQLPNRQKESLTFSLRIHSEDLLKEKIKILKGRVWLVAAASVASKFGLGPYSLVVDGKLIRNKVKFYFSQLFPDIDSEEFRKLPEDLQQRLKKFNPKSDEDLVEWLKLFDPDGIYNIRMVKRMVLTRKPFAFVHGLLHMILDEMQETALALLKWSAEENVEGEEKDTECDAKSDVEAGAECDPEGGAKSDVEGGTECDTEGAKENAESG